MRNYPKNILTRFFIHGIEYRCRTTATIFPEDKYMIDTVIEMIRKIIEKLVDPITNAIMNGIFDRIFASDSENIE